MSERYYPEVEVIVGRQRVPVSEISLGYLNNGYGGKEGTRIRASNLSQLRKDQGVYYTDKENWNDALLMEAMEQSGAVFEKDQLFVRPRVKYPNERKPDHFTFGAINQQIVFYVGTGVLGRLGELRFIEGTVICCVDDTVHIACKREWHTLDESFGRNGTAHFRDPDILLKDEYNYLCKHPKELEYWLSKVSDGDGGEYIEFKNAMRTATAIENVESVSQP